MLVNYKVSNFKSINDLQEFRMVAGPTRGKKNHVQDVKGVPILKNTIIFGANAGGKSSFIRSMYVAQNIIIKGANHSSALREMYCRNNPENKEKETYFEFLFENKENYYSYGFEIVLSRNEVTKEWAYKYDPVADADSLIFERNGNELTTNDDHFTTEEANRLKLYSEDISTRENDSLFLKEVSRKKIDADSNLTVFLEIFRWFSRKLRINSLKSVDNEEDLKKLAVSMREMGTDISDFKLVEVEDESSSFADMEKEIREFFEDKNTKVKGLSVKGMLFTYDEGKVKTQEICPVHECSGETFHLREESDGTREAFNLSPLLFLDDEDTTIIIDEYGSHMHPLLAYEFVNKFLASNSIRNNQLIIATHHTSLMTLDLFRRDEIWFVEKNNGNSEIYSLDEFEIRSDNRIDKAYLSGRFGALPVFKEIVGDPNDSD